jgi:hypothetical protein
MKTFLCPQKFYRGNGCFKIVFRDAPAGPDRFSRRTYNIYIKPLNLAHDVGHSFPS